MGDKKHNLTKRALALFVALALALSVGLTGFAEGDVNNEGQGSFAGEPAEQTGQENTSNETDPEPETPPEQEGSEGTGNDGDEGEEEAGNGDTEENNANNQDDDENADDEDDEENVEDDDEGAMLDAARMRLFADALPTGWWVAFAGYSWDTQPVTDEWGNPVTGVVAKTEDELRFLVEYSDRECELALLELYAIAAAPSQSLADFLTEMAPYIPNNPARNGAIVLGANIELATPLMLDAAAHQNLLLDGNGQTLTTAASWHFQQRDAEAYAGVSLALKNLTLAGAGGQTAGGVYATGRISLDTVTLQNTQGIQQIVSEGATGAGATVVNSQFINNSKVALGLPGGAYYYVNEHASTMAGDVSFIGSTFTGNSATAGGAIYIGGDFAGGLEGLRVENSGFTSNSATAGNGGAVYIAPRYGEVVLQNTSFNGNKAEGDGGAIFSLGSFSGDTQLDTMTFTGNTAGGSGGAVYAEASMRDNIYPVPDEEDPQDPQDPEDPDDDEEPEPDPISFTVFKASVAALNTSFESNTATNGSGGAVYVGMEDLAVEFLGIPEGVSMFTAAGTSFDKNRAGQHGGAVAAVNTAVDIDGSNVSIAENTAGGSGGAVYQTNTAYASTLQDEPAEEKGEEGQPDIKYWSMGYVPYANIANAIFLKNAAARGGAAALDNIWLGYNGGIFGDSIFTENGTAGVTEGGALYLNLHEQLHTLFEYTPTILHGSFGNNRGKHGGGVYAEVTGNSTLLVLEGSYDSNDASGMGGAVYSRANLLFMDDLARYEFSKTPDASWQTTFTANKAKTGGAMALDGGANLYVGTVTGQDKRPVGASFTGNTAVDGGAIYFAPSWQGKAWLDTLNPAASTPTGVQDILFKDNVASGNGGAIWVGWKDVTPAAENLMLGSRVKFTNSQAQAAFEPDYAPHIELHGRNVKTTAIAPGYTYAYNNLDVAYVLHLEYNENFPAGIINSKGSAPVGLFWYYYNEKATLYDNTGENRLESYNYALKGWSPNQVAQTPTYGLGEAVAMKNNLLVHGVWAEITYNVTYKANGGTGSDHVVEMKKGANHNVLAQAATGINRSGHDFLGWNTKADGTGATYSAGSTIEDITRDVVLYAQWKEQPQPIVNYTVAYNANGGTGGYTATVQENASHTVLAASAAGISRSGYDFQGWNTSADGTGAAYTVGGTFRATGNLTLYAQWKQTDDGSSSESSGGGGSESSSSAVVSTTSRAGSSSRVSSTSAASSSSSTVAPGSSSAPSSSTSGGGEPEPETPTTSTTGGGGGGSSRIVVDENGGYGEPGDDDYIEPNGFVRVFGNEIPQGGFNSVGGWSLVSLLLALLALLSGVVLGAHALVLRNRQQKGSQADAANEDEPAQPARQASILRRVIAAISGVVPLVFFLIVENMNTVILFNRWTPWVLALFLVHLGLLVFSLFKRRTDAQEDEANEAPQ